MIQKVKDEKWKDEEGKFVPVKYIPPSTRDREKIAGQLLKGAKGLHDKLAKFKAKAREDCETIYEDAMNAFNARPNTKGNFSFYNFDRSIKIEVSISERIDFDDLTIQACKQKLDDFLSESLDSNQEFIKEIVTDAFSTSKGKLDAKKVLSLMKYRSKIKSQLFQDAMNLLADSIRKPDSKTYFRIWERVKDGSYKIIDLNFSSL